MINLFEIYHHHFITIYSILIILDRDFSLRQTLHMSFGYEYMLEDWLNDGTMFEAQIADEIKFDRFLPEGMFDSPSKTNG